MKKGLFVSLSILGSLIMACNAPCQAGPQGGLHFSAQPDEAEIFKARVFDEPLIPIGGQPQAADTKALANALSVYANRTNTDDFSSLTGFLASFPTSPWSPSLTLHLGTEYYNTGHYSKALGSWEQAWEACKNITDGPGKAQADRALGELARMYSKLGRMGELSNLLASVTNRSLTGPGTQLIHSAEGALWMMQNRPGICFKCGPMALDSILSEKDPRKAGNALILKAQSTTNGIALLEVAELSKQLGMNYRVAFRSTGSEWIVPAVIHWKVGHYAALLRQDGNRFLVKDHTFHSALWMSAAALEEESSGYFLISPGPIATGWRAVSDTESQSVWGKGIDESQDSGSTGSGDSSTGGPPPPPLCWQWWWGWRRCRRWTGLWNDHIHDAYDAREFEPAGRSCWSFAATRSYCLFQGHL